jgi:translation initiation factor 2B subunit (eIF-2B alpha/beta/delta family)
MSVYFIHAEAVLNNGCVAEKIGRIAIADSAVTAFDKFFSDAAVAKLREQGINVVIDKFEKEITRDGLVSGLMSQTG